MRSKARKRRGQKAPAHEDQVICDALWAMKRIEDPQRVLAELKLKYAGLVKILHKAFQNGVVSIPIEYNSNNRDPFKGRFPGVTVSIIVAEKSFDYLASLRTLEWIRETTNKIVAKKPKPPSKVYIAIGGGLAMRNITFAVKDVLGDNDDLRKWFEGRQQLLQFINATAGGTPTQPQCEASFLATYFAVSAGNLPVGSFSVSTNASKEEQELIDEAVGGPAIVVSGIGVPTTCARAYCFQAMLQKKVLDEKNHR